jgi:hypothetical protein
MGLFGGKKSSNVTESAVQSVVETIVETQPSKPKETAPKSDSSWIVDILILVVIGGLLFFFVLWPLLIAYFCLFVAWILLWPFMHFIPACGTHHWAAPIYRVITVIALSPIKLCKMLYKQYKGEKDEKDVNKLDSKKAIAAPTDAPPTQSIV